MDKAKIAVQWIAQLVSTILISGRSRPSDKGGRGGLKKNFSALRASVWSNNKGGGRVPRASPSGSATAYLLYGDLSGQWRYPAIAEQLRYVEVRINTLNVRFRLFDLHQVATM